MNDVRTLSTAELQQGLDRDNGLRVLNGLEGWKAAGNKIVSPQPVPAA